MGGRPSLPGQADLPELFSHYYAAVPEGVVNDRWDNAHADYLTSEYEADRANERAACWENTRGIGFSFGYNQAERPEHLLDPADAVRLLVDVVSRGGIHGRALPPATRAGPQGDGGRWRTCPAGDRGREGEPT